MRSPPTTAEPLAPKNERKIISALRREQRASTVADVVSETSLPIQTVETALKSMLDEYGGQLKVTETGELLYYFPDGFRSRKTGFVARSTRAARAVGRWIAKAAKMLFKVWIVVMLVGYFVLFLSLMVAAVFASIAASFAGRGESRSRGRGGSFGMFYLTTRLLQTFFYLWMYSSASKKRSKRKGRPLHHSVFAYVFGEEDPNSTWDQESRVALIQHIKQHRGVTTPHEVASLTGLSLTDSRALLHSMLLEYEGDPGVTDEGTLYYAFPKLMRSGDSSGGESFGMVSAPKRAILPFNRNEQKMNGWITFFNVFNLIFGTYFIGFANASIPPAGQSAGVSTFALIVRQLLDFLPDASNFLFYGLGIVPVVFSIVFFAVTVLRRGRDKRKNRRNARQNFRRRVFGEIFDHPQRVDIESVSPRSDDERAVNVDEVKRNVVSELQADGDVTVTEQGQDSYEYAFPEIDREQHDLASFRERIDPESFEIGSVVYDSGSD